MIDTTANCAGCYNDFYNGHNTLGVKRYWHADTAEMVSRLLIHIDAPPPYTHLEARIVPSCYCPPRHVAVKPEAIDQRGYWK